MELSYDIVAHKIALWSRVGCISSTGRIVTYSFCMLSRNVRVSMSELSLSKSLSPAR